MELHNLKYTKGSRNHKTKTYGRGFGSGIGKTCGKGTKGQHSRKSGNVRIGFEGGQTPIYRKTAKVGFNTYNFKKPVYTVSLTQIINGKINDINRQSLLKKGLIGKNNYPIKLIGAVDKVKIPSDLKIEVEIISKNLQDKLTKAKIDFKIIDINEKTLKSQVSKKNTKKSVKKTIIR